MEKEVTVEEATEELVLSDQEKEQLKEIVAQDNAEHEAGGEEKPRSSKHEMFKYVTQAARDGLVSVVEKNRLRQELGIFQSDFTRKKTTKNKAKQKRKQQKKARRNNR